MGACLPEKEGLTATAGLPLPLPQQQTSDQGFEVCIGVGLQDQRGQSRQFCACILVLGSEAKGTWVLAVRTIGPGMYF